MRTSLVAGLGILVSACATPGPGKETDGPAGKPAPDLVRAQRLADALQVRAGQLKPVAGTMKLGFSPEALRAGESGSAIVAVGSGVGFATGTSAGGAGCVAHAASASTTGRIRVRR